MKKLLLFLAISCLINVVKGQDLLELLEQESGDFTEHTQATFKGSRIINGHSIETRNEGVMEFIIAHRFGKLNSGGYELFGLDQANVRFGFEYAVSDRLTLGVGRSSFEKTFDGFIKQKLMQQKSGATNFPISATIFSSAALKTLRDFEPGDKPKTAKRLVYTTQLLLARKFSPAFSLQLSPGWVHRNLVEIDDDPHDQLLFGVAGRFKLNNRVAVNLEYHYQINPLESKENFNSLGVGFDIETGGHVFQLHLTNSRAMIEKGFLSETTGNFFDGDIHFGLT